MTFVKRLWGRISSIVGLAALIIVCVASVLTAYFAITSSFFSDPPLRVVPLTQPPSAILCADAEYSLLVEVTPLRTTLVSFYLVVRDKNNNHYVDRDQTPLFEIPTEEGVRFTQRLPWKIPTLPPGEYERILGVRGHDPDEKPLVFTEKFTIGNPCKRDK